MASTFIGTAKGAHVVTAEQLEFLPTPESTVSWHPVKHSDLVRGLHNALIAQGIEVVKEAYCVSPNGLDLFGVFDMAQSADLNLPASFSMGFRHSNNKKFSIQLVAGTRVFVCSNLCFSGDMITLKRKHTSGLNLRYEIELGVNRYIEKAGQLRHEILLMQETAIDDQGAKSFLLDSVVKGSMPHALLVNAYRNYFDGKELVDCAPRTVWGLNNAITRSIRDANLVPSSKFEITLKLGSLIRRLL